MGREVQTLKINGESRTRLHNIWRNMINRTTYLKNDNYKYYGGRGIRVCTEWLESYMAFSLWAKSTGYTDNLSIDRIDNNGDYSPDNCRWITMKEQCENKRAYTPSNLNTPYNIAERCHKLNINKTALINELIKRGVKTNNGDFSNYVNGVKTGKAQQRLCATANMILTEWETTNHRLHSTPTRINIKGELKC